MKHLGLLCLFAASACALREPRVQTQSCTSNRECDARDVCFLGECRGRSAALSVVSVEVRPPNDSQLAMMQAGNIDLHESVLQDFRLQPPLAVSGAVRQEQSDGGVSAVADALVAFTAESVPIPDRIESASAKADATGTFTARLAPGTWHTSILPPAPLPPARNLGGLSAAQSGLDLRLPRGDEYRRVDGAITLNGLPLGGARVTAVDGAGQPLSAAALASDGAFSLLLPPSATSYSLQVGPATGLTAADLPNYEPVGPFTTLTPALALKAPAPATLSGRVLNASGTAIGGARVYAINAETPAEWRMLRSTTTASDGSWSLSLREGQWIVEAVPSADSDAPGISEETLVTVAAPSTAQDVRCPSKAHAVGLVNRPDGRPVGAGYVVNATRLPDRVVTARSAFTVPTDASGVFHVIGDRGRYQLEIVPPQSTQLPRKIVQVELTGEGATTSLPALQLAQPIEVVGTVHGQPAGGSDAAVAGATVDFFALDVAGTRSILLGSGVTDASGRFKAVLPDVPQPGFSP